MRSLTVIAFLSAAALGAPVMGQRAPAAAPAPAAESQKQIDEARAEEQRARAAAEQALLKAVEAEGNRLRAEQVPPAPAPPGMDDRIRVWRGAAPGAVGAGAMAPMRAHVRLTQPLKLEKAAFLGVSTSPVTAALREQLKLSKGIGLVVDHVEADSPAGKAGLKQYDILQKLDDQLLINTHQLSILVRSRKAGDEVNLHYIRAGQSGDAKVTLAEKDLPALNDNNPWGATPDMIPPLFLEAAGDVAFQADEVKFLVDDDPMAQANKGVERANRRIRAIQEGGIVNIVAAPGHRQATISQNGMTLRFERQGDSTTLRALDQQGREIFQGPVDTDDQLKALPKEVADQMDSDAVRNALQHLERGPVAPPQPRQRR